MKKILLSAIIVTLLSTNQTQAQCYSAVQLDGVDDYLHSPFSNYSFNNFTIEMWINSADYLPNDIYVVINQFSDLTLGGWQADGSFNTWSSGLNPFTINSGAGTGPSAGFWHHIAYVFDGTNQIIYIDGVPTVTVASTGAVATNNGNNFGLTIGARFDQTQQFTNTAFEDVRIWGSARTQAEIAATYSTNLTGNEPFLIAYYRFEEGVGSSTVADLTGNGNTLTMYNMDPATDWIPGLFSTPVDITTTLTVNTISSNAVGATYQWVDCNNGNASISGETNQSYTATVDGDYAVILTNGSCIDTSACVNVTVTGIDDLGSKFDNLKLYPNPTTGNITIDLNQFKNTNISIINSVGVEVFQATNITQNELTISLTEFSNGIYFVKVQSENEFYTQKIIKQ